MRVAVITHARKEPFFCEMWSRHYGALFGVDNLFLYKDGDDWTLPENARFGNVIPVRFPGSRKECDAYFASYLGREAAELLDRYDVVLRTDIDEFLVVDPLKGTWDTVIEEVKANGYLYALGLDVVQNDAEDAPLDLDRPILAQRRHASVRGGYCKPCAISRPVTWRSACHSVEDGPVILSKALVLVHLATMDRDLLESRLEARGDFNKGSYAGHAKSRFRRFDRIQSSDPVDLDDADALLRKRLCFDDEGNPASSPQFATVEAPDGSVHQKSLNVLIPERFSGLISGPGETGSRTANLPAPNPSGPEARLATLLDLLQPQRLTVVADVGASAIDVPPYAFLLSQGACDVWGFEPQQAEFDRLVASAGRHEHYLPHAVGDGTIKTLHVTRHPGFTSTLMPNAQTSKALNRWRKHIAIKSDIEVQTVRLDDLADLPVFDLLKIDIQGGEVNVFQNGTRRLADAVAIITETAAIPIYENQPLLGEQMQCLGSQGFHLHKFAFFRGVPFSGTLTSGFPRRKIADQLSDGDAVFIRSLLDLQTYSTEALKHLCILSDFVFHSASLTLKALELLVERGEIPDSAARDYAALLLESMTSKRPKAE